MDREGMVRVGAEEVAPMGGLEVGLDPVFGLEVVVDLEGLGNLMALDLRRFREGGWEVSSALRLVGGADEDDDDD